MLEAIRAENSQRTPAWMLTPFSIMATVAARSFANLTLTKPSYLGWLKRKNGIGVKKLGFCLMPNHCHFVLEQTHENALSQFMR
jgi:hypothetical protein